MRRRTWRDFTAAEKDRIRAYMDHLQGKREAIADMPFVRCRECGELIETAWELLGDTKPEDVTDYVCGSCDPDEVEEVRYDWGESDWDDVDDEDWEDEA